MTKLLTVSVIRQLWKELLDGILNFIELSSMNNLFKLTAMENQELGLDVQLDLLLELLRNVLLCASPEFGAPQLRLIVGKMKCLVVGHHGLARSTPGQMNIDDM